jgi:hypothetical protein
MADNSKKISELALASNVAITDRVVVLRSPAANASVRTITVNNFAESIKPLVQNIIPGTTVIANSVTVASNGTSNVAFFSYTIGDGKTGCCDITVHARDATTDSTTAGHILIVANTSDVSASVTSVEVGDNQILLTPNPTISSNVVTVYFTRSEPTTSVVSLRFSATVY